MIESKHLKPWIMLPAKEGTCPECAVAHAVTSPHNAQSMFYKYYYFNQHGRWPDWMDALEHCPLDVQLLWLFELGMAGVDVEAGEITPRRDAWITP